MYSVHMGACTVCIWVNVQCGYGCMYSAYIRAYGCMYPIEEKKSELQYKNKRLLIHDYITQTKTWLNLAPTQRSKRLSGLVTLQIK